ncbi:MAG TPA: glycosyltransferase family 4 protein [Candidatus Eisenbacteria bacterium]|nr:glycosyltransferase family 4 protein [Candidatus Eisenbacteria bacterium]
MKIAQVAPLYESVPPRFYGGTERVVSYLTEELVKAGHEVTLFASGDSVTRARLVASCRQALRLDERITDPLAYHFIHLEQVFELASRFDIIHFHTDYLHLPLARRTTTAHVTTLHGRLDIPDLVPLFQRFGGLPFVSISLAQRQPLSWINWQGTVYHGLPVELYQASDGAGDYLAFLGRISPEKRVDRAIEIAKTAGMKLRIAAKIDRADRKYVDKRIRPLLDDPDVECIGEINDQGKQEFLGDARALLFPIDWPEPFGLVLIEAMACGTPVIAYPHGSVPELVVEGQTGFVVDTVDAAAAAVEKARHFDRARCRKIFEERFTAPRMARDYLEVYERLISQRQVKERQKSEKPRVSRPGALLTGEARLGK